MNEWIEKAQGYVAASNAHDLACIRQMLAADCSYDSEGVGRHDGVEAIIAMMRAFFGSNPDVHWQADGYRLKPGCVEFDFIITLNAKNSSGMERVYFGTDDLISRIEVRR
jgi:limonene-1,2-epoxide hydrolase